jgi:hypothetical protein
MIMGMATRGGNRLRVFLIPAGIVFLCAVLLTCHIDLSVDPTYLDASRNWIADFGLGLARTADGSGWAFDYAGSTGDTYPYMTLTDTGAVSGSLPEGLDAAARAYRLSIANLMPDPDFALGAPVASRWGVGHLGGLVVNPAAPQIVGSGIHGNTLSYSRNQDQYISLLLSNDLLNASGAGAGPVDGSMYQINLLFYGSSSIMSYSPDLNDKLQTAVVPNATFDVRIQSQTFAASALDYYLYFGPNGNQSAYVDDIRVVRKAIPLYLSLDMRLSDANPAFISGRYVLSLWVKNDPLASYLQSSTASAPYQARALTLEIRALSRTDGGAIKVFRPADAETGWSEWTRLDLEFLAGEKLAIDQTDANPVFSLKISPADLSSANGLDAAQILIAQPSLTFHYE